MKVPARHSRALALASLVVVLALGILAVGAARGNDNPQASPAPTPPAQQSGDYEVPPPPLTEGIFPCSECHKDIKTNPERRKLTDAHDEIVLEHGERRWCLDCHNADNRDRLRLADGQLIDFNQSYLLCGQCHGDKFRDWKVGVHGKRTGHWNGKKQYLLCVACHNPHSPRFRPLKPLPPPVRPDTLRPQEGTTP